MLRPSGQAIKLLTVVWAAAANTVIAHPLGNNSITQFNIIYPYEDRVEVEYFVDFAELPSEQLLKDLDADQDGAESPQESEAWARQRIQSLLTELSVTFNGEPLPLAIKKKTTNDAKEQDWYSLSKFPGQLRGFWNVKFLARFQADYPPTVLKETNEIVYEDPTYPDTLGLRRILLDLSDEQKTKIEIVDKDVNLVEEEINPFAYEQYDPFNPPLEEVATYQFKIIGWQPPASTSAAVSPAAQTAGAVPLAGVQDDEAHEKFDAADRGSENAIVDILESPELNLWVLLTGAVVAIGWGAAHALAPGHAKTAVAAYLISQHGTFVHAVALALTVTFTHVFFVVLMGLIILGIGLQTGSTVQLWLGLISGALIAVMGAVLIFRAQTGRIGHHHHDHGAGHHHHHHDNEIPKSLGGWFRRLFSHAPPHLHTEPHHHHHDHDHAHPHTHEHHHHDHEHAHEHHHDHAHAHDHHHQHSHHHDHHDHSHPHDHTHTHDHPDDHPRPQANAGGITAKQIVLLGIAGGMVPCPAATGIMLAGISADRVVLALAAVGVFSIGLALMLMAVGVFALTSQRFAAKILQDETEDAKKGPSKMLTRYLPTASGMAVALLGSLISVHYAYMLATNKPLIPWLA
jgi:ABC-type nickel/cobalt efflux system permease component RcnA